MIDMERDHTNGTIESNGTIGLEEAEKIALRVTHIISITIMAISDPMNDLVSDGFTPEKITMMRFGIILRIVVVEAKIAKLNADEIRRLCSVIATNIGWLMGIPSQVALEIADSLADKIISNPEDFRCVLKQDHT